MRDLLGKVEQDDRFRELVEFYKLHDGAVLFVCDEHGPECGLAFIHGLEDQSAARLELAYFLDVFRIDEENYHQQILAQYDTSLDEILVVVAALSNFIVPLRGRFAGQMIRLYRRVNRQTVWAQSFAEGIRKVTSEIHRVSPSMGLAIKLGDEQKGGATALSLLRVKPCAGE